MKGFFFRKNKSKIVLIIIIIMIIDLINPNYFSPNFPSALPV